MRRSPLRARPPVDRSDEAGYRAWHTPVWGPCAVCEKRGLLLRHHVILEQHVRIEGGDPWALANSLALGYFACSCHRRHHSACARLPISCVPAAAIAFAVQLLGAERAEDYLKRYYAAP